MKKIFLMLIVAIGLVSAPAYAGWSDTLSKWKDSLGKNNKQQPQTNSGALVGGVPQVSSAAIDPCDDSTMQKESQHSREEQSKQIDDALKPVKDAAQCFDKYKNIKLGTSMGIPDVGQMLAGLMNQICNAADGRFNAATAPLTTRVNVGPFNAGTGVQTNAQGSGGGGGGPSISVGTPQQTTTLPNIPQVIN